MPTWKERPTRGGAGGVSVIMAFTLAGEEIESFNQRHRPSRAQVSVETVF